MQTTLLSNPANTLQNKITPSFPTRPGASDYTLSLCPTGHPLRGKLENFIATRYARRHKASISDFMPNLLALEDGQQPRAVLGLSSARDQALFLECYLDKPVEQAISQQLNTPVDRTKIVEIGNLAASHRMASQLLFTLLSAVLDEAGYRWLVFTATPCVRALVENLGFSLQIIGEAKAEQISTETDWGSYYATQPQVMLGCIDEAMRKALSPAMKNELFRYSGAISTIVAQV